MAPMPRERRTRDDLRRTLLEEGRAILADEGLETESSNLTFKRVFDRVQQRTGDRITNASVIRRVWENQAEFQTDVLVAIAQDDARPEIGSTVEAIAGALAGLDLSTASARARALSEVCRVGGNAHAAAIDESTSWTLWINVIALANSSTDVEQRQRIRVALDEGYRSTTAFWNETLGALVDLLGHRVRPPFDLALFVAAVNALTEGSTLRQRTAGQIVSVMRPTGPGGEERQWSLYAIALEALAHQFLEPATEGPASG